MITQAIGNGGVRCTHRIIHYTISPKSKDNYTEPSLPIARNVGSKAKGDIPENYDKAYNLHTPY